jgi:signal peptidase I
LASTSRKKKKWNSLTFKAVSFLCKKLHMPVPKHAQATSEVVGGIFLAGFAALAIRVLVFEPYTIPSGSMIPTMLIGDYLYVHKSGYGISKYSFPFYHPSFMKGRYFSSLPNRGDVVVFKVPTDTDTNYIKRLIGLPGDKIQMKEGRLYINGTIVPQRQIEDYVEKTASGRMKKTPQFIETLPNGKEYTILRDGLDGHQSADNTEEFTVPADHYFMMGDNRNHSGDSRSSLGPIPFEKFVGPAKMVLVSVESSILDIWKLHKIRYNRFFNVIR